MKDKEKQAFLNRQFNNLRVTSIFLFPIIAFLAFRAQDIIPFFFGEKSKLIVFPFQIIIWTVIFIYYSFLLLRIVLFLNRKSVVLFSLAIEALYAVVLNFYLIPLYGLEGISIATLSSLAIMFIFVAFCLTKVGIRVPFYKSGEKPAVATMGLMVVLHYVASVSFLFILLSSFVAYFLILIIVLYLSEEGLEKFQKISEYIVK